MNLTIICTVNFGSLSIGDLNKIGLWHTTISARGPYINDVVSKVEYLTPPPLEVLEGITPRVRHWLPVWAKHLDKHQLT